MEDIIREPHFTIYKVEIDEIKKFIDDYIDDWKNGKKLEKGKRMGKMETRNEKKKLYKEFETNNIRLYTYLKDNITTYKGYDIILLFMTDKFICLLETLDQFESFIDLIKLLTTKDLMGTIERGNLSEPKNETYLFGKYKCLDLNKDTKKSGIKCPCNQHHIMNIFCFGDVKNNKMLIFGSDCIWRIESIIFLIKDEILKRKFIEKISKERRTLDELTKKDKQEQERQRKLNKHKRLSNRCKEHLKKIQKDGYTHCQNFNYDTYKLNTCKTIEIDEKTPLNKIILNKIKVKDNTKYPFKYCNLCWKQYKENKKNINNS